MNHTTVIVVDVCSNAGIIAQVARRYNSFVLYNERCRATTQSTLDCPASDHSPGAKRAALSFLLPGRGRAIVTPPVHRACPDRANPHKCRLKESRGWDYAYISLFDFV